MMNIISIVITMLAMIISLVYAVSNYRAAKRRNQNKTIRQKDIAEIKNRVGVSNKGETLDESVFFHIPFSKIGV